MLAKNLTALGKLCLILLVSGSAHAQSWSQPLFSDWQKNDSIVGIVYNASKWYSTRLDKTDSLYHSQAVYHALNNAENGQTVEWFNDYEGSHGKVLIAMTWPANGDICRRIHHYVSKDRTEKSWGETACMNNNTHQWVFQNK
jgi:surface antigen